MATINTTFFQLVTAFFIAFILAHMTTKYFERFDRFPSPLVTMGPEFPAMVQGRDYIPHRFKPTLPPGPAVPLALETDGALYETTPPLPALPVSGSMTGLQVAGTQVAGPTQLNTLPPGTQLPYPMTGDNFLSFIPPEKTLTLSPARA